MLCEVPKPVLFFFSPSKIYFSSFAGFDNAPFWAVTNFAIKITSWELKNAFSHFQIYKPSMESISLCGLNSTVTFIFKTRWERRGRYDCPVWQMQRAWCLSNYTGLSHKRTRERGKGASSGISLHPTGTHVRRCEWLQVTWYRKPLSWGINLWRSKCLKYKQSFIRKIMGRCSGLKRGLLARPGKGNAALYLLSWTAPGFGA